MCYISWIDLKYWLTNRVPSGYLNYSLHAQRFCTVIEVKATIYIPNRICISLGQGDSQVSVNKTQPIVVNIVFYVVTIHHPVIACSKTSPGSFINLCQAHCFLTLLHVGGIGYPPQGCFGSVKLDNKKQLQTCNT